MSLKALLFHLILPLALLTPILSTIVNGFFVKEWTRITLLLPRLLFYILAMAPTEHKPHKLLIAYLIESFALMVVAWLFGRSIL
jgi:hypothetical protein